MMLDCYILSGGRSRRFGSDKGRMPIDGVPNLLRLHQALAPHFHSFWVVSRSPDDYADLGLPVVADPIPDQGPLQGLHTALNHQRSLYHPQSAQQLAPSRWIVVGTCDALTCDPAWWFASLPPPLTDLQPQARAVTWQADSFQPFPGMFSTCLLGTMETMLAAGDRSMQSLKRTLGDQWMTLPSPNTFSFEQVNTPEELEAWRARQRPDRNR
jgi:molybdopterin-guanine dinucleotide biosynthesis protein A